MGFPFTIHSLLPPVSTLSLSLSLKSFFFSFYTISFRNYQKKRKRAIGSSYITAKGKRGISCVTE